MDLLQGEQPEIWAQSDPPPVDLSVGDIPSQIAKLPSLFRMVLSLTPYDLSFPKMEVPYAPMIREWPYICNKWYNTLHVWF